MLQSYWGLEANPFQNSPDEGWLFESPPHDEALSRLLYVVEERHCCGLLCGPAGTGKSLVLALVAQQAVRMRRRTVSIDLAGLDADAFVWRLAAGFQRAPQRREAASDWWKGIDDYLNGARLSRQHAAVILDHADAIQADCRDEVRRLVHLADRSSGSLTVLVALRGQVWPEWCAQLRRFAAVRIELGPLNGSETERYVAAALHRVGCRRDVFPADTVEAVYQRTRGVPRHVNRLCQVSLLAAMADNRSRVEPEVVHAAALELDMSF